MIPANLVHGRKTEVGEDNFDTIIQSIIAGNNSVNVTQHVVYQKGPKIDHTSEEMKFSTEKLDVPKILSETIPLNKPIVKECPLRISEEEITEMFDQDSANESNSSFKTSIAQDFSFLLTRAQLEEKDLRRNWTAFNRDLYSQDPEELNKPADIVAPCPIIPHKADDHETINTVIERSKVILERIGRDRVWFTSDAAVNAPANEVKWTRGNVCILINFSSTQFYHLLWFLNDLYSYCR